MITNLFDLLGNIAFGFINYLKTLFEGAISIIYDYANEEITPFGTILLLALGTGLVIWGFRFIRRLIRVKTN